MKDIPNFYTESSEHKWNMLHQQLADAEEVLRDITDHQHWTSGECRHKARDYFKRYKEEK